MAGGQQESGRRPRQAQAGLPNYTPLHFRYNFNLFLHNTELPSGRVQFSTNIVLLTPKGGGALPDGLLHSFTKHEPQYGQPYIRSENGKVIFAHHQSWWGSIKNPHLLSQRNYQQAIYAYCNFLAAVDAENAGEEDFLLLEDDLQGGSDWVGFEYPHTPVKRTHRRIIGRYRSRLGVEYALAQRTHFLESLAGRGRFSRYLKRTEYEVQYPYTYVEGSLRRSALAAFGFEQYMRENQFLDGPMGTPIKLLHIAPAWMRLDAEVEIEPEVELLEKAHYTGGDGRLLRDHGNGQFGSYPSFEGDENPE